MAFHIFRHVETLQFDTEGVGQLFGNFSLTDASRSAEQERANRLAWIAQPGAGHLDRLGQRFDSFVLTEDNGLQIAVEILQRAAIIQ